MATGPEHYREAEDHLASAARNFLNGDEAANALAAAQAHATLALAAATALRAMADDMPLADRNAWHRAAATTGKES